MLKIHVKCHVNNTHMKTLFKQSGEDLLFITSSGCLYLHFFFLIYMFCTIMVTDTQPSFTHILGVSCLKAGG